MKTMCGGWIAAAVVCVGAGMAWAQTTYHVNGACGDDAWSGLSAVCAAPDGPKKTIKAAIAAAQSGDTVEVADGVYTGIANKGINFGNKAMALRSENGPANCIIDCEGSGIAFVFVVEALAMVVDGFTITGGSGTGSAGGAMWCHHQNTPTFVNCIITGNKADRGGAIAADAGSAPMFINCTITGNTAKFEGGGVHAAGASPTFINCTISGNAAAAGGGVRLFGETALMVNTVITGNKAAGDGGGVLINSAKPVLVNATISGNIAGGAGGGIASSGSGANVAISNTVVWGNAAGAGAEIALVTHPSAGGGLLSVGYSDVKGGQGGVLVEPGSNLLWGAGNIDADPLFIAPGNFRPGPGSPVIDAADNTAVPAGITTDRDGKPRFVDDPRTPDTGKGTPPIVDMGAYEFQGSVCYADCDGSGALNIDDFVCFQLAFALRDPYADCDGNSVFNIDDFVCFQLAFALGCP